MEGTVETDNEKIPVICIDTSSASCAELFDPNEWEGTSKAIIYSTWNEFGALEHCLGELQGMCTDSEMVTKSQILTILDQWKLSPFDLERVEIFAQQSDLHIRIRAFFSGVKSVLDLLSQLLSTEGIVTSVIDAFHRSNDNYGGRVLNSLNNNAPSSMKKVANDIEKLILTNKSVWIDSVIEARDLLTHGKKGMGQLMFPKFRASGKRIKAGG